MPGVTEVVFYEDCLHDTKNWPGEADHGLKFKAGVTYKVPTCLVEYFKAMGVAAPPGDPQPDRPVNQAIDLTIYDSELRAGSK